MEPAEAPAGSTHRIHRESTEREGESMARLRNGAVIALAALALACGGEESATHLETGGGEARVQRDGDAVRVSGRAADGGRFEGRFGANVELPEDFPGDVPAYPGARPVASMSAGEQGAMATLESADAPEAVFRFYREHLDAAGWTVESQTTVGDQHVLNTSKDRRQLAVAVSSSESGSQIVLTISSAG
jgi:hypothetical protein